MVSRRRAVFCRPSAPPVVRHFRTTPNRPRCPTSEPGVAAEFAMLHAPRRHLGGATAGRSSTRRSPRPVDCDFYELLPRRRAAWPDRVLR
jgi:hypothetical protein